MDGNGTKTFRHAHTWLKDRGYGWPEPIIFETDIEIIVPKEDKVIGIGKKIELNRSWRGPAPIYTLDQGHSFISIKHGGFVSNIKWREASGPSRAYYNGCGWHIVPLLLKWEDEGAKFEIRTGLSFMNGEDHEDYTKGFFDCKLYTYLGNKTS